MEQAASWGGGLPVSGGMHGEDRQAAEETA